MGGMLPLSQFLAQLFGARQRRTPEQLYNDAYPTYEKKTAIDLPPEEFLSAPVTEIDRKILGLAPRGMLYQLNKQALDRELDAFRRFHSEQRAKPKSI